MVEKQALSIMSPQLARIGHSEIASYKSLTAMAEGSSIIHTVSLLQTSLG